MSTVNHPKHYNQHPTGIECDDNGVITLRSSYIKELTSLLMAHLTSGKPIDLHYIILTQHNVQQLKVIHVHVEDGFMLAKFSRLGDWQSQANTTDDQNDAPLEGK